MSANRRWFVVLVLLAIAAVVGSSALAAPPAASQPVEIIVLHVNDNHGQIDGAPDRGGEARLATRVGQIRAGAKTAGLILLHTGDVVSRGDALTTRTFGLANMTLMNRLGYDAWVPGNGDFYMTQADLLRLIAQAKFPTLAANVTLKDSGKPIGRSSIVLTVAGVKVALFGLCFVRTGLPFGTQVELADPIETARRLVPGLRKQADLVVAATHIGVADDEKLAREVAGIDLIIGGHSHTPLPAGRPAKGPDGRNVLICQTGGYLRELGQVTVRMAPAAGGEGYAVQSTSARLLPLDKSVQADGQVLGLIAELKRGAATMPDRQPAAAE